MSDVDREALCEIFDEAGGRNWRKNEGWCTDVDIRKWHGIRVNADGRVVELHLQDESGLLPSDLWTLPRQEKWPIVEELYESEFEKLTARERRLLRVEYRNEIFPLPGFYWKILRRPGRDVTPTESTRLISTRLWTLNALKVLNLSGRGLSGETHKILDIVVGNTFVIVVDFNTVSDISIATR